MPESSYANTDALTMVGCDVLLYSVVTRPPGTVMSYVGREQVAFAEPPPLLVAITVKCSGTPECNGWSRERKTLALILQVDP